MFVELYSAFVKNYLFFIFYFKCLSNVCLPSTLFRTQSMLLEDLSSPNLTTTPVHLKKNRPVVPGAVACTFEYSCAFIRDQWRGMRVEDWEHDGMFQPWSDQHDLGSNKHHGALQIPAETLPRFKRTISRPEGEKLCGRRCNYAQIITSWQFISENMNIWHRCLGYVCISTTSNY